MSVSIFYISHLSLIIYLGSTHRTYTTFIIEKSYREHKNKIICMRLNGRHVCVFVEFGILITCILILKSIKVVASSKSRLASDKSQE